MKNTLLINALRANAAFSATTGAILVVASVPLSSWLGIAIWISIGLGLGLLGFAAVLVVLARDPQPALVRAVILADAAWVAGAVTVIAVFPDLMSTAGLWALALVSVVVAELAVAQYVGLRRVERQLRVGEPVHL
jgi:hypothetical protein